MRQHILIIANPAAGRLRTAERRLGRFIAALERQGCRVVLRRAGISMGEVERLAREAEPAFEAIIAAGGDGTVNAVVNGIAGRAVPVGVLPLGTANVLAREIGLPRDPEPWAGLIANGPASPVWPGRIGARAFVMMASAGFDSEVVAGVRPELKRWTGRLAFAWAMLGQLCSYRGCELIVRADGVEHRAAAAIAAKGKHYAGPFIVAPDANLSEPTLAFVLFHRRGRCAVLRYAIALFLGLVPRLRDVAMLRASQVTIAADRALPVQADGEIVDHLPVTLGVANQPVFLIQPG